MQLGKEKRINIAIFASGGGTNFENICKYIDARNDILVACVVCNNANAYVVKRAEKRRIDMLLIDRSDLANTATIEEFLCAHDISLIVLAGFLWLVPPSLTEKYTIINIHPALLPKYGGKGMYGTKVHQAVFEHHETQTGITIHYVNNNYDDGTIIFQQAVDIAPDDTPESIEQKVHNLEQQYFPKVVADLCDKMLNK